MINKAHLEQLIDTLFQDILDERNSLEKEGIECRDVGEVFMDIWLTYSPDEILGDVVSPFPKHLEMEEEIRERLKGD